MLTALGGAQAPLLKLQATMTRQLFFMHNKSRPGRAWLGSILVLTFRSARALQPQAFGGDLEGHPPSLVLGLAKDTQC